MKDDIKLRQLLLIIIAILAGIIILGGGYLFGKQSDTSPSPTSPLITQTPSTNNTSTPISMQPSPTGNPTGIGMPNPASVFCTQQGGTLSLQTKGDGGQYNLCDFGSGQACEEWALFRGACPIGGIKTTGYDTIQQKYCAWSGGSTLAVENATCTFTNGISCSVESYYDGTCSSTQQ